MAEKYRKNIYCQKAFIKQYVSRLEENSFSRDTQSVFTRWEQIKEMLLCSDIKLYLDFTSEEYDELLNDIYKKRKTAAKNGEDYQMNTFEQLVYEIDTKQYNNEIHLKLQNEFSNFEDFMPEDSAHFDGIYFVEAEDEICKAKSENYGIVVINLCDDLKELSKDCSFAIAKNSEQCWDYLLNNVKSPSNVLILVDNYILNDTNSFKDNIEKIFQVLLPEKLTEGLIFQILIVTTLRKDKRSDLDIQCRYDRIVEMISSLKPKLRFNLTILKNSGEQFHDRTIITNNLYISCGGGFDLFKNGRCQKTTTVNSFNLYININARWLSDAYSNLVHDIYKVYSNSPDYTMNAMPNFLFGVKDNRIIENCR